MLQIVQSIHKMTGEMVKLPADEDTPEKVCMPLVALPNNFRDNNAISGNSEWIKSSTTWIATRTPSSHMMSSSRAANKIPRS
jgi:hypothetical protein